MACRRRRCRRRQGRIHVLTCPFEIRGLATLRNSHLAQKLDAYQHCLTIHPQDAQDPELPFQRLARSSGLKDPIVLSQSLPPGIRPCKSAGFSYYCPEHIICMDKTFKLLRMIVNCAWANAFWSAAASTAARDGRSVIVFESISRNLSLEPTIKARPSKVYQCNTDNYTSPLLMWRLLTGFCAWLLLLFLGSCRPASWHSRRLQKLLLIQSPYLQSKSRISPACPLPA